MMGFLREGIVAEHRGEAESKFGLGIGLLSSR